MHPEFTPRDIDRFWSKVDRSGGPDACWPWTGKELSHNGYGRFYLRGRRIPAHRVAWELVNGPIPDGFRTCHHCDNPPCCNPDHLFLGTDTDNQADKVRKGRQPFGSQNGQHTMPEHRPRGEHHGMARLDEARVRSIRARFEAGETITNLAGDFGVSYQHIYRIVHRQNWKHLA